MNSLSKMLKEIYEDYVWLLAGIPTFPYGIKKEADWTKVREKKMFKLLHGSEQYLKKDSNESK